MNVKNPHIYSKKQLKNNFVTGRQWEFKNKNSLKNLAQK